MTYSKGAVMSQWTAACVARISQSRTEEGFAKTRWIALAFLGLAVARFLLGNGVLK